MKKLFLILPVLLLIFTGCSDNSTNPTKSNGRIKMYIADSPASFDEVNIEVTKVEVHSTDNNEGDNGWVTINNKTSTYDLLQLRNGANAVLGDSELSAGHYTQIRLMLSQNCNVVVNGVTYPLILSSQIQSGLKLNHEFDIEANTTFELLLDFDASSSILLTGSGQYFLNPVVRVAAIQSTGSISGFALPSEASPIIYTIEGSDTVRTTTESDNSFKLVGLTEGNYNINFQPTNINYKDTVVSNINVTAGQNTKIDTIRIPSNP